MSVPDHSSSSVRRPGLFILIAMSTTGPVALNIFIPSMPGLQSALNVEYATAQLTLTLYLISLAISQLFVGPISDRIGRRPVVLAGTVLFIAASVACAFAQSIEALIFARALQAAGGCVGISLARAIIRDLYGRNRSASLIGYVTMTMVVVPMLAPIAGGFLDAWGGWRVGFYVVAVWGAIVLVFAGFQLHETRSRDTASSVGLIGLGRGSAALIVEPAFLGYALNSAFSTGIFFAFLAGAPFIMTSLYGQTPADYGLYFILVSVGYMFGNYLSGRFAEKLGSNRLLVAGTSTMIAGMILQTFFLAIDIRAPYAIFLPMGIIAMSNGLTIPNAIASSLSLRPEYAGAASGLTGFLQIGIGALATYCVSLLHDGTALAMYWVMLICGVLTVVFLFVALIYGRRVSME
ncbi:MAG: multidrug effflux MFS transporter [Fimbriimonadaceae bacterium]|nr:multidrug effflux MFS transporter [Alphaproteobacteria bacterium]